MRVVSLLPSATEIVAALGMRDALVGVTHECDFPPGVEALPHLTANLLAPDLTSREIDAAVSASLKADAHSIYRLDAGMLRDLGPDVILTQALCEVCAVPTATVDEAVCTMPAGARVVSLDPPGLDAVFEAVERAAAALGVPHRGRAVAIELRAELDAIRDAVAGARRPRVLAAEWLDPVFCGGHWVPEMVEAAGGRDPFGQPAVPARRIEWTEVAQAEPDVVVLMPCGYYAPEVVARYQEIAASPEWQALRAVREGNVYAVDATSYFSRPGPRLVEGTRVLARILHPEIFTDPMMEGAAFKLVPGTAGFELYR